MACEAEQQALLDAQNLALQAATVFLQATAALQTAQANYNVALNNFNTAQLVVAGRQAALAACQAQQGPGAHSPAVPHGAGKRHRRKKDGG